MSVGQSNQPYSAPRPRSIPTWGSNQDPNVVMAAWQAQIASNISNAAPQAPPKNFTVTNAVGGLTLNWGQVQGADGYELLKSPNGSFKTDLQVIPIAHNSQTSYFDSLGGSSSTCSYRIRTTSGTPQTPQSARGPESGPIAHTSIATGATTTPTTIRDISSTDKSSSITRLGNYGNFKTPGSPGNSAAASSTGGTSGSASNPSTGSSAYDPAGAAAAAQAAAEAYANATFIPEAVISTAGQIIYGSAPTTATILSIGSTGQVLTVAGGLPVWSTAGGGSGAWSALTGAMTYTQVAPWYNATSTVDSGISRLGAASLAIGNGIAGDTSGSLTLGYEAVIGAGKPYPPDSTQGNSLIYLQPNTTGPWDLLSHFSTDPNDTYGFLSNSGSGVYLIGNTAGGYFNYIDFNSATGIITIDAVTGVVLPDVTSNINIASASPSISFAPTAVYPGFGIGGVSSYPAETGGASIIINASQPTAAIAATAISSGVLTVTVNNALIAGQIVRLTGTEESFLNNQQVTVLASGLSSTTFKANFAHADYSNASDTGTLNLGGAITLTSLDAVAGILFEGTAGTTMLDMSTTGGNQIFFEAHVGSSGKSYADLVANSVTVAGIADAALMFGNVTSPDTGISRLAAASLAIGNGTAGDYSGSLKLTNENVYGILSVVGDGTTTDTVLTFPNLGAGQGNGLWVDSGGTTYNVLAFSVTNVPLFAIGGASAGQQPSTVWASGVTAGWSSTATLHGTLDTGISRLSAGVLGIGTGAATSTAGSLVAANVQSTKLLSNSANSDMQGVITGTTTTAAKSYSSAYTNTPVVIVCPLTTVSTFYLSTTSTTGFTVTYGPSESASFNYMVVGNPT